MNNRMVSLFFLMIFWSCTSSPPAHDLKTYHFPYQLNQPYQTFTLPTILEEISGLSFVTDDVLATVQDEQGIVFLYDLKEKEIFKPIEFHEDGDYEGIAVVGKTAYVLRSDGVIFEVQDFGTSKQIRIEYDNDLSDKNNTEGLCYDATNNRLLIVCKEKGGTKKQPYKNQKGIYAFDLKTKQLTAQPVFLINNTMLLNYLKQHSLKGFKLDKEDKFPFKPSGIAVHPTSKNIYIIAAAGNMLMVLSPNGTVLHLAPLKRKKFPQPEGITFSPNGDLYLASEGDGGKGKIWRFRE